MPDIRIVALTGSDQAVEADAITNYYGFTIRETSGSAAAVVRIYDNASAASGGLLESIGLAAGTSLSAFYGAGIDTANGVYVKIVSGAVEGSLRVAK